MKINNRWKIKDQAKLFNRLGHLLKKGYTLSTAIEFLMLNVTDEQKKDLQHIILKLKQGAPFFSVFNTLQFSNDGLSYIFFSEKYGELANGLINAGKILEKKEDFIKKTEKILRYPLFLIILFILLTIMMQKILLPQFIQLYESMNVPQSNIITFLLLSKSTFPPIILLFFLSLLLSLLLYFFYYRKKTPIEQHIFLCKIPFIRYVVKKYNTYFFSFHFGNLLESGLSINEALTVFEGQGQILFYKKEAERIRTFLVEGERLEHILKTTSYYDKELATVILHGQANGNLSRELIDYSSLLLDEFEETVTLWLRALQPMLILLVGSFVVALYLSVMLPIYGVLQSL